MIEGEPVSPSTPENGVGGDLKHTTRRFGPRFWLHIIRIDPGVLSGRSPLD